MEKEINLVMLKNNDMLRVRPVAGVLTGWQKRDLKINFLNSRRYLIGLLQQLG